MLTLCRSQALNVTLPPFCAPYICLLRQHMHGQVNSGMLAAAEHLNELDGIVILMVVTISLQFLEASVSSSACLTQHLFMQGVRHGIPGIPGLLRSCLAHTGSIWMHWDTCKRDCIHNSQPLEHDAMHPEAHMPMRL